MTGRLPFYLAVSLSAVVAIVVGIRLYRPAHRLPWVLFAISQSVYFAADVAFYTYHDALKNLSYPAPADALYLAHYPFLVAGLLVLNGRRQPRRRGDVLDTLIVGTAFALLAWIVLMDPYAHDGSGGLLLRLTSLAYPVMDLMVLFAAIRLVGPRLRVPAMAFLATALVFVLFSDFVYSWLQVKGRYGGPGDFLDATWMAYYLALGAAALSPSMRSLGDARIPARVGLGPMRILALTIASAVAPVTAIVEDVSGKPVHVLAVACASIVLYALVVARLADVAGSQRRDHAEKERLLGRVVEVAEHERMRVAADLHDGPFQKLSAVTTRLDLLAAQVGRGEIVEAAASARRLHAELVREMQSLQRLMASLGPPTIDERGIGSALTDCAEQVIDRDVVVKVESSVDGAIAPELELVIYRIAREAFLNVERHAQARRVDASLWSRDDRIVLSIRDDGVGFDVAARSGGSGLTSMRELAQSAGGTVQVISGRSAGTEVRAVLPYLDERAYGRQLSQVTSAG